MLPGDAEVPRGGIERLMAQQHLDRPDVAPGFEPMGGTAMPERLETVAVRDPRGPLGVLVDLLRCANGHRPGGSASRT
jgi:hypothetical protein